MSTKLSWYCEHCPIKSGELINSNGYECEGVPETEKNFSSECMDILHKYIRQLKGEK